MKKFSIFIMLTFIFFIMSSVPAFSSTQSLSETDQFFAMEGSQIELPSVNSDSFTSGANNAQPANVDLSGDLTPVSEMTSAQTVSGSAAPIPGAAWILAAGLLGLISFRKKIKVS